MMKRTTACLALLGALLANVAAGEFNGTAIGASLGWIPSECPKPLTPSFDIDGLDAYNAAVDTYNAFLEDMRAYRACMIEEAQQDANEASKAISEGMNQANQNISKELESTRAVIESAKQRLE